MSDQPAADAVEKVAKSVSVKDPELVALHKVGLALDKLTDDAALRCLRYHMDRRVTRVVGAAQEVQAKTAILGSSRVADVPRSFE